MKKLFILFTLSFLATTSFAQDLKFLLKDGIIMQMRKYDSTAVKTAINAKMSYTDTSGMLSAYRTSANNKVGYTDTSSMLSAYGSLINSRVNYTDTSSMLSAYSTAINTKQNTLGFTPYNATNPSGYITSSAISGKVNYTDTSSLLSGYNTLINARVKYTDTSSMLSAYSTAINTKQNALGFTPYNSTNPSGYITSSAISGKVNYTDTSSMLSAYSSLINSRVKYTDTSGMLSAYSTAINTKQNSLGFTPYNATNPSGYITSSAISGKVNYTDTSSMLAGYNTLINARVKYTDTSGMLSAYSTAINTKQNALGFTPYNATNPSGYITSSAISGKVNYTDTSSMLSGYNTLINARVKYTDTSGMLSAYSTAINTKQNALGFTPYNSTNPSGYITSSAISGKVNYTDTASMLSAYGSLINSRVKYTDTSGMLSAYSTAINTKQNALGFTPYNATNPSGYISSYTETDPIVKAINGLVKSNGTTISTATAGTDYLTPTGSAASLTSFPTFNQNTTGTAAGLTIGRTISISGDLAYTSPTFNGTSNVSAVGTLATVNSNVGTFNNATITVNAKGLITSAANGATPEVPITFGTGLTRSTNTVTVNPSQNITTLSNLTTNGYVKTSAGVGTLGTSATIPGADIVGNITGNAASITGSIAESQVTSLVADLAAKQATLVSGTSIKTINSTSLLGSGDITVGGDDLYSTQGLYFIPSGFQDATFTSIGGVMTAVGTPTAKNWASTNILTKTKRVQILSAATAGALAEQRSRNFLVAGGDGNASNALNGFEFKCKFSPSNAAAVSGERFFAGVITSANVAATNVEPSTLIQCVGIAQLSTDNTQFYLVYGGSTAQTPIALGTAVGSPSSLSTTLFELKIVSPKSPANNYIVTLTNLSTGVIATQTVSGTSVQVPQSTLGLGCKIWKTNNATALAVGFDLGCLTLKPNL